MPSNLRKKRAQNKQRYFQNRQAIKKAARAASRASYKADLEKKRAAARASFRAGPDKHRVAKRASYKAHGDENRAAKRARKTGQP